MINLSAVEGFDWDAGNARKSAEKHRVSQAEAEQVFLNEPLVLLADPGHSHKDNRFHALGRTDDGRRLLVTFTMRMGGRLVRVISAREMSRRERAQYASET